MTDLLFDQKKLSNKVIRELYKHCTMLANSKYKEPIKVLQSRNIGYTTEDFVQETMQILLDLLSKKSFDTLQKLKSFAFKTMEFHYLKEKRKYFYTKQRGSMQCISIEENILPVHGEAGQNYFSDELEDTKSYINSDDLTLQNIYSKNLLIAIKHNTYSIVEAKHFNKLPDKSNMSILSLNHFMTLQHSHGFKESCKYYKSIGFNMTKKIYDNISTAITAYLHKNNLIELPETYFQKLEKPKSFMHNPIKAKSFVPKLLSISDFC